MQFFFSAPKAIQAVAALLRHEETRQMGYLRLLKILYIADRESMNGPRTRFGRRVRPDPRKRVSPAGLGQALSGQGLPHKMTNDPGVGMLSKHELRKLRDVADKFALMNEWDIVRETHKFEEWIKNSAADTTKRIPVEDILRAVGRADDIEAIAKNEKDRAEIDRLLKDW